MNQRLRRQLLKAGRPDFSPAYFDNKGVYLPLAEEGEQRAVALARAFYRADVEIGDWNERPPGTSALRPVRISLSWPVNPVNGEPMGSGNPKTEVTYAVTTLTGPDWPSIYPPGRSDLRHREKVEF